MRHSELIDALRRQSPHDADATINLMGAAARALEDEEKLHRDMRKVLGWSSAYIRKAMAEGLYDGCVVSGEKALEYITDLEKSL